MELTKELYEFIENECEKFQEETLGGNNVDVNDVLYSYLYSTKKTFCNDELNEHSAIVFLKQMCEKIDNYLHHR